MPLALVPFSEVYVGLANPLLYIPNLNHLTQAFHLVCLPHNVWPCLWAGSKYEQPVFVANTKATWIPNARRPSAPLKTRLGGWV